MLGSVSALEKRKGDRECVSWWCGVLSQYLTGRWGITSHWREDILSNDLKNVRSDYLGKQYVW